MTMQCRKVAMKILDKLEVTSYFSNIFSRDESYDRLEQIQKTLGVMNLNPDNTLVIGDKLHDVECAKKAGCQRLIINDQNETFGEFKIITKLSEIKEIIKN